MPRRACPLLFCILAAACGDEDTGQGTLLLSWSFLDGRTCADSGVEQVVARRRGEAGHLLETFCSTGYVGSAAKVSLKSGSHSLVVEGMSAQLTALYSGHVDLDLNAGEQAARQVKLAFVGGR